MIKKIIIFSLISIPLCLLVDWTYLNGISTAKSFHKREIGFSKNINTYDSNISPEELIKLFEKTLSSTKEKPILYKVRDQIDFPGVTALWEDQFTYRTVNLYLGNDSKGITWSHSKGTFKKRKEHKYEVISNWEKYKPFQP